MDINAELWPEMFLKFGPYAVLALFVIWVIPHTSKRLRDLPERAPRSVQVCTSIAVVVSWTVVLFMVGYIAFKWSPVRVYHGQLGMLNESEKIVPISDKVYVKAKGLDDTSKDRWEFVLVTREDELDRKRTVDFVYIWGEREDDYNVYRIPIGVIVDGQATEFSFVPGEPTQFYKWGEDTWQVASSTTTQVQRRVYASGLGWNAHADDMDHIDQLARKLDSPNRLVKIESRLELRELSVKELEMLDATVDDQGARELVRRELERRR